MSRTDRGRTNDLFTYTPNVIEKFQESLVAQRVRCTAVTSENPVRNSRIVIIEKKNFDKIYVRVQHNKIG